MPEPVPIRGRALIVADDLGSWPHKSDAILIALESGLVRTASMMATFPDTERACAEVRDRGFADTVGAHLNLTEGLPVTDAMQRSRFCDEDGRFGGDLRSGHRLWLSPADRDVVSGELRAQLDALRREGLSLTHIDSHHHVHNHMPIAAIVIELARQLGVPRIRLARNLGRKRPVRSRTYVTFVNARLRRAGLAGTTYFGSVRDYRVSAKQRSGGTFELAVHPLLAPSGLLVDESHPRMPLDVFLNGIL